MGSCFLLFLERLVSAMSAAYKFEYEADWKIFRKLVVVWVERYFQERNESYIRMLQGEGTAKDKWWKLKDLMKDDIKTIEPGTDMRRSRLIDDLFILAGNGVIMVDDLEKFTPKMQRNIIFMLDGWVEERSPGGMLVDTWYKRHGLKRPKMIMDKD